MNDYFDVISASGDLKIKKPDKRIFTLTHEKLGCEPDDCTYVDDRRKNLAAAESLGMKAILFNSRDVSYDGMQVTSFKELLDIIYKM